MMFLFIMHGVHLSSLDLNLLPVLDALLRERHLTRAATQLGLSQSAASHVLGRLRRALGDPLFVRAPTGLVPTERALSLEQPLRAALAALSGSLATPAPFDPSTARRSFALATTDYGAYVVLPALMERLTREAPGVDVWVRPVSDAPVEQLARGEVDAVLSPLGRERPSALHARKLFDERFVGIARRDHPALRGGAMSLAAWSAAPHVFIAPRGRPGGVVDSALAKVGRSRRVALSVPQFLIAPHVVTRSDLVGVLGARLAESLAESLGLQLFAPPVRLPTFAIHLVWHARSNLDPAQKWFRALLRECVTPGAPSARAR